MSAYKSKETKSKVAPAKDKQKLTPKGKPFTDRDSGWKKS